VDGLTDEQMTTVWQGEWSVNHILAHTSAWHRELVPALERIARGERPILEETDYSNLDQWNAGFAEGAGDRPPADVLAELKASKSAFEAAARALPDEKFEEGRAAHRILHLVGIDHYAIHEPEIRQWRRREGI
jgi:hypothetical protein